MPARAHPARGSAQFCRGSARVLHGFCTGISTAIQQYKQAGSERGSAISFAINSAPLTAEILDSAPYHALQISKSRRDAPKPLAEHGLSYRHCVMTTLIGLNNLQECFKVCPQSLAMSSAFLASPLLCRSCMPASQAWCSTVRANKRLRPTLQQRCGCKQRRLQTCALADSGASTKTLKETAALDQLIDLFLGAKSQQQVGQKPLYFKFRNLTMPALTPLQYCCS